MCDLTHWSNCLVDDLEQLAIMSPGVPAGEVARDFVNDVLSIHNSLKALPDLGPSKSVDDLFGRLVKRCCKIHGKLVVELAMSDESLKSILPSLHSVCSNGEFLLEKHWGEQMARCEGPDEARSILEEFPYYDNYKKLCLFEIMTVYGLGRKFRNAAIIGSGPLPLTSLFFLDEMKKEGGEGRVLNIDRDSEAIEISKAFRDGLGSRGEGMSFAQLDINEKSAPLETFEVVILAALVGHTQAEKEETIARVVRQMKVGAVLLVRSSWGLRKCLYPEFDASSETFKSLVHVHIVAHPYGDVVNSVIAATVRPGVGRG
ncbi:hypothetical protein XA68_18232 [Ophiocordyceps unilateralis]|uniref:Nicotianamine synthase n=1 Tax=Ophiocordyceps unilateralis TaxID=268505 RepID=A0A2A9PNL0_OPHUN|nr:hypothetical protein XA68_18232 [Ophiocordyceps unilateralis]